MQINPYLNFNGQCEEAFKMYEKVLGGKIVATHTYEGSPMAGQMPADWAKKIMHVQMTVDGSILMGSDAPPPHFEPPKGILVSISIDKAANAERIFHALSEGGAVRMPIQQTFWAVRFGMLVDKFGIPWMVNCEKES